MDTFRLAITVGGLAQAAITGVLGLASTPNAPFRLPALAVLLLGTLNAGLTFALAALPAWEATPAATAAVRAALGRKA